MGLAEPHAGRRAVRPGTDRESAEPGIGRWQRHDVDLPRGVDVTEGIGGRQREPRALTGRLLVHARRAAVARVCGHGRGATRNDGAASGVAHDRLRVSSVDAELVDRSGGGDVPDPAGARLREPRAITSWTGRSVVPRDRGGAGSRGRHAVFAHGAGRADVANAVGGRLSEPGTASGTVGCDPRRITVRDVLGGAAGRRDVTDSGGSSLGEPHTGARAAVGVTGPGRVRCDCTQPGCRGRDGEFGEAARGIVWQRGDPVPRWLEEPHRPVARLRDRGRGCRFGERELLPRHGVFWAAGLH